MGLKLSASLRLTMEPVALLVLNTKPNRALQFRPGTKSCVMYMLMAAADGKTAVFDQDTCGCPGGEVGLGLESRFDRFPGGYEGFCGFLSSGNQDTEKGKVTGARMEAAGAARSFVDKFLDGESYKKNKELAGEFLNSLPTKDADGQHVVFKRLSKVDQGSEEPICVTLLVNADQLSALVLLANYDRPGMENVAIPYAAACQVIGIMAMREAATVDGRCLVGLTDITARKNLKKQGMQNRLSFTVPFKWLLDLENNIAGSFLEKTTWASVIE